MYEYRATVLSVVDGDTIDAELDLGFHVRLRERLRLAGINAPELHGTPDPLPGQKAKAALEAAIPPGSVLTVRTEKDRKEKYGRFLAHLTRDGEAETVNLMMVRDGHAAPYAGGKR